jgi:small-conductance mechanosensitive channel
MMKWEIFSLDEDPITLGQLIAVALTIVVVLSLTSWLIRMVSQRLLKGGRDANLVQLSSRLIWFAALTVLFFTALSMLNVPLGAFAFVTGAIAIGIGFGAQNIINNFISGWILMGERPIRIGDLLEVNNTLGRVEAINTRSTRIKRTDGVRIVIPKSESSSPTVTCWKTW